MSPLTIPSTSTFSHHRHRCAQLFNPTTFCCSSKTTKKKKTRKNKNNREEQTLPLNAPLVVPCNPYYRVISTRTILYILFSCFFLFYLFSFCFGFIVNYITDAVQMGKCRHRPIPFVITPGKLYNMAFLRECVAVCVCRRNELELQGRRDGAGRRTE